MTRHGEVDDLIIGTFDYRTQTQVIVTKIDIQSFIQDLLATTNDVETYSRDSLTNVEGNASEYLVNLKKPALHTYMYGNIPYMHFSDAICDLYA